MNHDPDLFAPSRLALARKRRGLTLVGLAQRSDTSARSLSAYERGDRCPGPELLADLADVLRFPLGFFYASDLEEIPEASISFRAAGKHTAGRKNVARSAARIAILINQWIEKRFRLPGPDVPCLPLPDPETAAQVVRFRWGLGQAPAPNMTHLLEIHGVRVFALPPDCVDLGTFSLYWRGTPFLFLNPASSREDARLEAAHELGHLVQHSQETSPASPPAEAAADQFAADFLMPTADVLARSLYRAGSDRIQAASRIWKVSPMALANRLHELNLLDEQAYRTACVNLARFSQPGDGGGRETSQVLSKVFAAMRAEHVRLADIARDLHLTREEFTGHVHSLAPTVLPGNGIYLGPPPDRPPLQVIKSG